MWESIALVIAAILAAYAVAMSFRNTFRSETLDDKEKELEKISADLDERANRIAAEEETLKMQWAELRQAKEHLKKEREGKK